MKAGKQEKLYGNEKEGEAKKEREGKEEENSGSIKKNGMQQKKRRIVYFLG